MKIDNPFNENFPRSYRIASLKILDDIQVVEIGYNRVPHGLKQIFERDEYILHYVINGKGEFADKKFNKEHGFLTVPKQFEKHIADEHEPYEAYWIAFKGEGCENILNKCGLSTNNQVFMFNKNIECAKTLKKALFDICPKNDYEEASIMHAAFFEIISIHARENKVVLQTSSEVAQNTKKYIKENYYRQINISEMAKSYNITRNYLYTLFKKEYNISPKEYILKLRIEKAKQLLLDREKKLSVSEIAFTVGFNDALYFSRVFVSKTGLSPSKYRQIKN